MHDYRQIYMPYCLVRLKDGTYLPVNRRYKPLGTPADCDWVDYDTHPAPRVKLTPARIKKLSWKSDPDEGMVFLYEDGCSPNNSSADMHAYMDRVALLLSLEAIPGLA